MACSHRWFTWSVPRGIPPVGSYPTLSPITCAEGSFGHRLVCSLLHLTWRRACAAPPLGFLARAAFPDPVDPRVIASPDFALYPGRHPGTQRRVGRPRPSPHYTLTSSGARLHSACPGAATPEEDDPGRGQVQFDPLRSSPAHLPARVVSDGGVEPDAGAFGLDHPLVRRVFLRFVQRRARPAAIDSVARTERLYARRARPEGGGDPVVASTFIHPTPDVIDELPERNPLACAHTYRLY